MQKCLFKYWIFFHRNYFQCLNKAVLDFTMNNSMIVWDSETFFFLIFIYLYIWLRPVLVAACRIF